MQEEKGRGRDDELAETNLEDADTRVRGAEIDTDDRAVVGLLVLLLLLGADAGQKDEESEEDGEQRQERWGQPRVRHGEKIWS
jgi:hypothetical protein